MSVNGVTSTQTTYSGYTGTSQSVKTSEKAADTTSAKETEGVIYESGKKTVDNTKTAKKVYKQDTALIAKLKADAEARTSQLKSLVEQLISKQGKSIGQADSIWSFLAGGDFTVDPATKAQAQADIAEDGYWGVEQTSDRIVDFAKALAGSDPDKADEMLEAFKKGFKQATKTWGGTLPDISQRTYDAVLSKMDAWKTEASESVN